jgi:nucleotide sugar dehydrogenase
MVKETPIKKSIDEKDIDSFEKCRSYTVSIMEGEKIGILHACLFAEAGFRVISVNANPHTSELLRRGRTRSFGKSYKRLKRYLKDGAIRASSDARKATSESDIIVVAVQPTLDRKKKPDYSQLESVCKEVGMGLKEGSLVLFVSPTGPGLVESSLRRILEQASGLIAGKSFGLASSPFKAGSESGEKKAPKPLRVVGAIDEMSLRTAWLVLNVAAKSDIVKVSSIKSAEVAHLFQSVNIETNLALANEQALLCEKLDVDFFELLKVLNERRSFLPFPGIRNDSVRRELRILLEEAENANTTLRLTLLAGKVNDEIANHVLRLVRDALHACGKTARRAKVSIMGISQRSNDREAPGWITRRIISLLKKRVRTVAIYDPHFSKKEMTDLGLEAKDLSKAIEGTDCLVFLAAHSRFSRLNLRRIKLLSKKSPSIVDVAHVIDPSKAKELGFEYRGLGMGG